MPSVEYDGVACHRAEGESVLDALLRAQVSVPHACKAGACGSCLLRCLEPAKLPMAAQAGLKDTWKAAGYFLACVCRPDGDIAVGPVGQDVRLSAHVASIEPLSDSVLRVRLRPREVFEYRAGQYVTLIREDGLARSYSLASLPEDDTLELHVRVYADGRMSQWLAREAAPGTVLQVQGPSGDCFYTDGRSDQPLLLVGTGTGLAPLLGIVHDALRRGHRGPLHLVHGAAAAAGLYLQDELIHLAARHSGLHVWHTTLDADGPIEAVLKARLPSLSGFRAFVCGDSDVVRVLKKHIFLAGAALSDIHSDAFLPSAQSSQSCGDG